MVEEQMEGTIKWFNVQKGYGFIKGEDGEDYFFHYTALEPEGTRIRENDKVSFESVDTDRGKQAQKVNLLEKGSERTDLEENQEEPASSEEPAQEESDEKPQEETQEE